AANRLGPLLILVPIAGAVVVGLSARYGSAAIRGHGIPDAMEQVLLNKSRIPARVSVLKPVSAAISIGAGGPFGAEGPIIATGGAGLDCGPWTTVEPPGFPGRRRRGRSGGGGHAARSARPGAPRFGARARVDPQAGGGGVRGLLAAGGRGPHGAGGSRAVAGGVPGRAAQAHRDADAQ